MEKSFKKIYIKLATSSNAWQRVVVIGLSLACILVSSLQLSACGIRKDPQPRQNTENNQYPPR